MRGDQYTFSEARALAKSFGHGLLELGAQEHPVQMVQMVVQVQVVLVAHQVAQVLQVQMVIYLQQLLLHH